MHYAYVLLSEKDGDLYAGYTMNIVQRLRAHNEGSVLSTKNRRPLKLIFSEGFINKYDALRRERYFKTNEGKKMLKLVLRETLAAENPFSLSTEEEVRRDMQHWKDLQKEAEEIVRDRGWNEKDDDFLIQIEEETKHLWNEEVERERQKSYYFQ